MPVLVRIDVKRYSHDRYRFQVFGERHSGLEAELILKEIAKEFAKSIAAGRADLLIDEKKKGE